MCPQNKKEGASCHISKPATSGTQNAGEPSAHEGGQKGVRGAEPPGGGLGGCPPHKTLKGGPIATLATLPRVGPETLANPKLTRVGKRGSGGRSPLAGGLGGVPHKTLKGGRVATLATLPRVGPKTLANPKSTGVGKKGVQGAKPPGGGVVGGVPPQNLKRGASCHISNPATSGTQNAGEP